MTITVHLGTRSYDITLERGAIGRLHQLVNLDRQVLVVTDDGVPSQLSQAVLDQCPQGRRLVLPQGESTKTLPYFERICRELLRYSFTRKDCLIAVGGGVMGDLAGFAAASYMRGIDFINIPTTALAQIDSSIGGKVAVDLDGVKNIVGAFYQPKAVIADLSALDTLPPRQLSNGLAEAVKAGLIADPQLFALFEEETLDLASIVRRSLEVKRRVVEQDETEHSLRAILNFGHTLGHGIESSLQLGGLYHGECVALGMLPMIEDPALRERTIKIFQRLSLPTGGSFNREAIWEAVHKDKKSQGNGTITLVKVPRLGQARLDTVPLERVRQILFEEAWI